MCSQLRDKIPACKVKKQLVTTFKEKYTTVFPTSVQSYVYQSVKRAEEWLREGELEQKYQDLK